MPFSLDDMKQGSFEDKLPATTGILGLLNRNSWAVVLISLTFWASAIFLFFFSCRS
jgi:hypothetical protein